MRQTLIASTLAAVAAVAALAALALSTFTGTAAMTQIDHIETRNQAIVQTAFDGWSAGSGSPFDLLSEDASWTIVGRSDAAGTYASKATFLREVIAPFNARMRVGIRPTIRSIHADRDTVIIFFDASGTARDGQPYNNTYAWFMTLKDDKVVRVSAFFDSLTFNDLWRRVSVEGN